VVGEGAVKFLGFLFGSLSLRDSGDIKVIMVCFILI
jgi:hypothetical protein